MTVLAGQEFYLDEMPGETRAVIRREGQLHALYIERESDRIENRLGSQSVGRVARVEPGLKAAFIDLGAGEPFGFMSLPKGIILNEGQKVCIAVTAEARESKGPALKYLGEGQGDVRLVTGAPSLKDKIRQWAGNQPVITGLEALQASLEAEEEVGTSTILRPEAGLDLSIERTRALIAVDIDYAPLPGRDSRKGREAVNRIGLLEASRQLRLRHWAGTVVIDLAGVAFQGDSVANAAKAAFADWPGVAIGPISRFGLLQVAVPWGHTPLDERLAHSDTAMLDSIRRLNLALLSDRATPVYELVSPPDKLKRLAPWVEALGPRARLSAGDVAGKYIIRQG